MYVMTLFKRLIHFFVFSLYLSFVMEEIPEISTQGSGLELDRQASIILLEADAFHTLSSVNIFIFSRYNDWYNVKE